MQTGPWTSYVLIFFDCDSTLSSIEGIDELARIKGKELRVGLLTDKAMNGELDLAEVYGKRLRAIRPTKGQLKEVEQRYWETTVEDAKEVVAALQYIGKTVFIISGGLLEAVKGFGIRLGVDEDHIRAVELEYNAFSGEWWKYHDPSTSNDQTYLDYNEGPLTVSTGKPDIIKELTQNQVGRKLMIGDGSSDLATRPMVDLFVGFGGVVSREKVKEGSEVFIESPSLAPILPIAGGKAGYERVKGSPYQSLYEKGIEIIKQDNTFFESEEKRQALIHLFENQE
ncbi:hypothetical protein MASR2M15_14750 [Anaerolineales bacterium]